jgi:ZIP family zinc transporter
MGFAIGLLAGFAVFFAGDWLIDRRGGDRRKHSAGHQAAGSALAILLGIVLDGIPEAIAATTGLGQAGWAKSRILGLWLLVTLVSGLAALAGYALFDTDSPGTVAFVLSFAAGAILTMLADTMMPEAFESGGKLVGVFTTVGFALAFVISSLE